MASRLNLARRAETLTTRDTPSKLIASGDMVRDLEARR